MNNQRFSNTDYDNWCKDYLDGLSLKKIAEKYSPNGPSISIIRKVVSERGLQRSLSEAQKGRKAWNKGVKGSVPWNKDMAKSRTYPYPSPFKGRKSPFKGVPRSQAEKDNIAHALRLQNRLHYGYYKERENELDTLYLIKISSKNEEEFKEFYKIGRTFNTLERRYSYKVENKQLVKEWRYPHYIVFDIEHRVLNKFTQFFERGPEGFAGLTEFFSAELPVPEVIDFIETSIIELTSNEVDLA